MVDVNLLPLELAPKKNVIKAVVMLRKIAFFGFIFYLIILIFATGTIVHLSRKQREIVTREEKLKSSIKALKDTEVKLVLVQDRLEKAKKVLNKKSAREEIISLSSSLESLKDKDIRVNNTQISASDIKINFFTPNSSGVSELLSYLVSANIFKYVSLDSLSYSGGAGYRLSMRLEI